MKNLLSKHRFKLSTLGLVVTLVVGTYYIVFNALGLNPFLSTYSVTMHFPNSGGVQVGSSVNLRGARVGKVTEIRTSAKSIDVVAEIESKYKISANSIIQAHALSTAGEQYVDIRPNTDNGPYLEDGDSVQPGQIKDARCAVPDATAPNPANTAGAVACDSLPFADVLSNAVGLVKQIDSQKLDSIVTALDAGFNGNGTEVALRPGQTQKPLKLLLDSAGEVLTKLSSVTPETIRLIRDAGTIFETTSNIQPDLGRLVKALSSAVDGLRKADAQLRELFARGPGRLTSLTGSLTTLQDPITSITKVLVEISRQGALRAPALTQLMPSMRDGATALGSALRDGALYIILDILPRPYCDYQITPTSPNDITRLTVPTNLYCASQYETTQVRGAWNAPRPPGDDTQIPGPNQRQMSTPLE